MPLYAPSPFRETFIRVADPPRWRARHGCFSFPVGFAHREASRDAKHEWNVLAKAFGTSKQAMFPFLFFLRAKNDIKEVWGYAAEKRMRRALKI